MAFTDGACSGNPGPGGWAFVLLLPDGHIVEGSGAENPSTSNRMEMRAAISLLKTVLKEAGAECELDIACDSKLLVSGATSWLRGWKARNWITSAGQPVK